MNCLNPLNRTAEGFPKRRIDKGERYEYETWANNESKGTIYTESDVQQLRCRKCVNCLQQRAREWATRAQIELKYHSSSCVLTLTYATSPRSVSKQHVQKFLKRLRKRLGINIRYIISAEYGTLHRRPHYHAIIFGWCPDDCIKFTSVKNKVYYTSQLLTDVWGHGLATVDRGVSKKAITYCVGYVLGKLDNSFPQGLEPPFQLMSSRPAIGRLYFDEHFNELCENQTIYVDGSPSFVIEYYDRLLREKMDKSERDDLILKRSTERNQSITHKKQLEVNNYRGDNLKKKIIDSRKQNGL
ncbi:replication initiator protein [Flyfo microvirus Tbat2_158]|nr:replication initiator protein [Flyfo microvirus Tbat2_158]